MAALYGTLRGNGAEVTRTGTKASDIVAQVQTFKGGIRVRLAHDGAAVVEVVNIRRGTTTTVWQGNAETVAQDFAEH